MMGVMLPGGEGACWSGVYQHMNEQTMRKGTFSSWVVPALSLFRVGKYYFCRKSVCFLQNLQKAAEVREYAF